MFRVVDMVLKRSVAMAWYGRIFWGHCIYVENINAVSMWRPFPLIYSSFVPYIYICVYIRLAATVWMQVDMVPKAMVDMEWPLDMATIHKEDTGHLLVEHKIPLRCQAAHSELGMNT